MLDYSHYFTQPSPKGNWYAAASGDADQASDNDVPVFVTGVQSLLARGDSANLIINRVVLKNRTQRTVTRVSLKWLLTAGEEQATVVLQGDTPHFYGMLPTRAYQKADIPLIDFAKIARPLMKAGVLDGQFLLKLRVGEAKFADGTTWRYDAPAVRFIKAAFPLPALPQTPCPNRGCGTGSYGQTTCNWFVSGASGCTLT